MPARKGLLAPQNTFLDTIATRFDGTRKYSAGSRPEATRRVRQTIVCRKREKMMVLLFCRNVAPLYFAAPTGLRAVVSRSHFVLRVFSRRRRRKQTCPFHRPISRRRRRLSLSVAGGGGCRRRRHTHTHTRTRTRRPTPDKPSLRAPRNPFEFGSARADFYRFSSAQTDIERKRKNCSFACDTPLETSERCRLSSARPEATRAAPLNLRRRRDVADRNDFQSL